MPSIGSVDPVLDGAARAQLRARLIDLQQEIDEAERFGDRDRVPLLRSEFEFITHELAAAVGLGGRARGHTSEAERARQSATKAIHQAIERIDSHDHRLAEHLRHTVRTGALCCYAPDPRVPGRWRIADPGSHAVSD
jgi:hypothetical protein